MYTYLAILEKNTEHNTKVSVSVIMLLAASNKSRLQED